MIIMNRYMTMYFAVIVFSSNGCTTCHENVISSINEGAWVADVRHRECGGYSGYSVAVYESSDPPAGSGDGEKEPFQAIYKTESYDLNDLPVHIQWVSDNHLIIRHDTRMNLGDAESKPMVIKAEKSYREIVINYEPEPVLWKKGHSNLE